MGEQMDANLERAMDRVQPRVGPGGDASWQCRKCLTVYTALRKAEACQCEPVKADECHHGTPRHTACHNCEIEQRARAAVAANKSSASDRQVGGDHYKRMAIQTWDVVDTWPLAERIGFYRGSVLKYAMRAGSKGDAAEDARKAAHYAEKLAETLEGDAK